MLEMLSVVETDPTGELTQRIVTFEPSDLDAAYHELDERAMLISGADGPTVRTADYDVG